MTMITCPGELKPSRPLLKVKEELFHFRVLSNHLLGNPLSETLA